MILNDKKAKEDDIQDASQRNKLLSKIVVIKRGKKNL